MPLDSVLVEHLDQQEILEDALDKDIEELLGEINIPELMADVEGVLTAIVGELQERLRSEYYATAVKNGIELAKNIEEDGKIEIQRTKNKDLNA